MSGGGGEEGEPRRLHPATVLVGVVRRAPSTLLAVPGLLAVTSGMGLRMVAAIAAALVIATALPLWLRWRSFTYALGADAVVIRSGVLSRTRRTIPYARLSDVGIERRPLQRLFGLATVTLETGGAGADEGALDSVAVAEAERLRIAIRRRGAAAAGATVAAEPGSTPSAATPLFAMDARRVLLSGLFNFSLLWIAVGFGVVQYAGRWLGLDERALWNMVEARTEAARALSPVKVAAAAAVLAAAVLAVGVVAGLVRTGLRDAGFRLADEGGRLRRSRGLFTRSEAALSLRRVQLAAIDTGPLRRQFGWARLRAQSLGGGGEGSGATGRQDLAPFARADEVDRVLAALRLRRLEPADLTPVSRGHAWRMLARRVGLPLLLVLAAAAARPAALLALPLLAPLAAAALLDRRHHRYRLESATLHVQRGVWGRETAIVPAANVQVATVRRSWMQRRLGLATLLVDVAGGGRAAAPDIHDLREADAWALAAALRGRGA